MHRTACLVMCAVCAAFCVLCACVTVAQRARGPQLATTHHLQSVFLPFMPVAHGGLRTCLSYLLHTVVCALAFHTPCTQWFMHLSFTPLAHSGLCTCLSHPLRIVVYARVGYPRYTSCDLFPSGRVFCYIVSIQSPSIGLAGEGELERLRVPEAHCRQPPRPR